MVLALDSDGVFADFDLHVLTLFGKSPRELGDDAMWELVNAHPDFWLTMPKKAGSEVLWDAVKHLDPVIITGCPKGDYDRAAEHKRIWWKTNFDWDNVITCLSKNKAQHMTEAGDVLVDDMYKNIKRWREAGGIGILHKNVEGTLDELRNLLIIQ